MRFPALSVPEKLFPGSPLSPRRREGPELLDDPCRVIHELPANLADIRMLNRRFGGTRLALSAVLQLTGDTREFTLLDVATGSADIPLAIVHAAAPTRTVQVTAMDASEEVLSVARRWIGGTPVRLVQGDARALPWSADAFDVVMCCLALHHFPPAEAVEVLREMWRVCRRGIVVTDLVRSYPGYAGAWVVTHMVARNAVTRHDAPLSVLRSYTPGELRQLAREAGIDRPTVRRHPLFRQVLTAKPSHVRA